MLCVWADRGLDEVHNLDGKLQRVRPSAQTQPRRETEMASDSNRSAKEMSNPLKVLGSHGSGGTQKSGLGFLPYTQRRSCRSAIVAKGDPTRLQRLGLRGD